MKKALLLIVLVTSSIISFSQEKQKTLDIIYLTNGESFETRIVRVGKKDIYYLHPKTYDTIERSLDELRDYEFNDTFFQTNSLGFLEHKKVVWLDGYNKDEIYRAIKDWFVMNSRGFGDGIYLDDSEHLIILGYVNTPNYFKGDFVSVMSLLDDNPQTNTYTLKYSVNVRVKDDRFKVYITDFSIQSNTSVYEKMLKKSYEKRKTKKGALTVHGKEINSLKKMITEQIAEIRDHCESVREYDTFHNRVVKYALEDDDW